MSAALLVLPRIWATAAASASHTAALPILLNPVAAASSTAPGFNPAAGKPVVAVTRQQVEAMPARPVALRPELAFYRKYTEALLTRYVSMSMEAGRVPSLLGQEMFRGKVTSYRVHSFEDVVIFVHDVEQCLKRLDEGQQFLIRRICLQRFTQEETAQVLGTTTRTTMRRYADSLDRLTRIFLEVRLLEPLKACQEAGLQKIQPSGFVSTT